MARLTLRSPRRAGEAPDALTWDVRLTLIEQVPQIIGTEVGITQYSGEGAATEFPMQRDDESVSATDLLQAYMTATLSDDFPALLAQRLDQALAGDDRLAQAHAGRGIERRITPLSSGSPSSRRPST